MQENHPPPALAEALRTLETATTPAASVAEMSAALTAMAVEVEASHNALAAVAVGARDVEVFVAIRHLSAYAMLLRSLAHQSHGRKMEGA